METEAIQITMHFFLFLEELGCPLVLALHSHFFVRNYL